jgi:adenosyl cobinamide kinase/adenosyl cobinamide phosphate guanylyltransferase
LTRQKIVVGIVGPCKSGKSIVRESLEKNNHKAHHIAQEHSYSPTMWQQIVNPEILVCLDVSYQATLERSDMNWSEKEYGEQQKRLAHAREHADFYILTDNFTGEEVIEKILGFLKDYS